MIDRGPPVGREKLARGDFRRRWVRIVRAGVRVVSYAMIGRFKSAPADDCSRRAWNIAGCVEGDGRFQDRVPCACTSTMSGHGVEPTSSVCAQAGEDDSSFRLTTIGCDAHKNDAVAPPPTPLPYSPHTVIAYALCWQTNTSCAGHDRLKTIRWTCAVLSAHILTPELDLHLRHV